MEVIFLTAAAPAVDPRFQSLFLATSVIALVFQISATALIAVVSFIVSRAVRHGLFPYWASGWACYTGSLLAVLFAFRISSIAPILFFAYFFLEYAAIVFIFAGCRHAATGLVPGRRVLYSLAPAAVVAALLTGPPFVFLWRYTIHNGILGLAWFACLVALWPAVRDRASGPGVRLTAVGLLLLALDYFEHCACRREFHPGPAVAASA